MEKPNIISNIKLLTQITKLLIALVICAFLLLGMEILFSTVDVSSFLNNKLIQEKQHKIFWLLLWIAMFLQITVIPIPALPIYIVCNNIPGVVGGEGVLGLLSWETLFFTFFVTSACLIGSLLAYGIGRFGGKKIVKWIAGGEEDFNYWCNVLNKKQGKFIYALTVFLPIFPDDLLSIVVGSLKVDFTFYVIINAIGKITGVFFLLLFMRLPLINKFFTLGQSGSSLTMVLVYTVIIFLSIVLIILCSYRLKKLNK